MSQALRDALQTKYGLTVNDGAFVLCTRDIEGRRARLLSRESSRISHYSLSIQNEAVALAFDPRTNKVTAVLDRVPIAP